MSNSTIEHSFTYHAGAAFKVQAKATIKITKDAFGQREYEAEITEANLSETGVCFIYDMSIFFMWNGRTNTSLLKMAEERAVIDYLENGDRS